jgi:hypothetical protein
MSDVPSSGAPAPVSAPVPSPAESAAEDQSSFGGGNTSGMNQPQEAALEKQIQAQNPTASKEAVKKEVARVKKLKLKVDGEDFEESFNPDDDEYLTRQLQLARVSQKRMQETAQLRKQVQGIEDYLSQAKGDPKKLRTLLRDLGADEKALAAQIIEEEISNSQKSPEQLEKEQLQNELQRLKDENEKKDQDYKSKEFERLQAQEYERYDVQISQAIEKSDLPKKPYVVKKMADYMLTALQNGVELTPDEIMPLVREEIAEDLKQMLSVSSDDVIEALIGKDVLNRLRKKSVAKAKANPPQPIRSGVKDSGRTSAKAPEVTEKKSFKQFFGV